MKIANILICILYFCLNVSNGNSEESSPGAVATKFCQIYIKEATKSNICPKKLYTSFVPSYNINADKGEFPHMVEIGYEGENNVTDWLCSGFIISKNYVITTAHCVVPRHRNAPKILRAGVTDETDMTKAQIRSIDTITVHPEFKPPVKYNDIALIKVKDDFELNSFVYPACLYTSGDNPVASVIHSGWGPTNFDESRPSNIVKLQLSFNDNEHCNKSYSRQGPRYLPEGIVKEKLVCAGGDLEGCQHDAGGPLQIYHKEDTETYCLYDVVGVSSFGVACGLSKHPSVYTRVSYYVTWIEDIVWPQK